MKPTYDELAEGLRALMGYVGGFDSAPDHPCGQAVALLNRLEQTPQVANDGATVYRGVHIVKNPNIRPSKLGRYSVEGVPFPQLSTAKEHIDRMHKHGLVEMDPLI